MANRFQLAQHDPKLAEQLLSISNRNRFVLPNGSNEDQIKWVIQHSSGVWNGSDLAPGLQNTLKGVLDADIRVPGNSIGLQDCANLIRAMSVGFDAFKPKGFGGGNLFTGTDVMYRVPGLTRNTLWFSSGGSPVNRNLWRVSTFSIAGGSFVARRRVTWTFYNYLGKR